jgi:hypothetical protein
MPSTQTVSISTFLRWVLRADSASCIAMGLLLMVATGPVAELVNLPVGLLRGSAFILLPFGAFVFWLSTRERASRSLIWTVIVTNALWVADSVLLLMTPWVEPNALGYAFVIVQAAAVAALAELQYVGMRRAAVVA